MLELPVHAVACAILAHVNGFHHDVHLNTAEKNPDGSITLTLFPHTQYRVLVPETLRLERARHIEER